MTLRAILVLVVTLAFGAAPLISQPFTGYDPAAFPVRIERPAVQPAGYAFAIWSVIYLWLIAHAGFGLAARAKSYDWDETRVALAVSLALGTVWLFVAAGWPVLATVGILVMAATALVAFLSADAFYDRWLLSAPLGLYAGWLTAASAVSVGILLAGWGVLSDTNAALAAMTGAFLVAVVVQWLRPEMPLYGAAVVWALAGIAVANFRTNVFVLLAAAGGAAALASLLAEQWRRRRATGA
jgi:hypothetical protein